MLLLQLSVIIIIKNIAAAVTGGRTKCSGAARTTSYERYIQSKSHPPSAVMRASEHAVAYLLWTRFLHGSRYVDARRPDIWMSTAFYELCLIARPIKQNIVSLSLVLLYMLGYSNFFQTVGLGKRIRNPGRSANLHIK